MDRPSIVLIGPWNFHSGAGEACRGNLRALSILQDRYSIHAMGLQHYGPHRLFSSVSPSLPGPECSPEVVIIHLNPDMAPSLLSQKQRHVIQRARHRIGFWVWENLQVPHGWTKAFGWIDSLWVPSRYCEELFSGLSSLPIDVIPHVITVDDQPLANDLLSSSESHGTILYAFDGASYLRRKNPAALIRAFHHSGLARQGWRLILKTKNFEPAGYDSNSYEDFMLSLQQLRSVFPDSVEMVTADLDDAEFKVLMRSVDIYASPHASEGFGLTIAEAMAAGVLVVATDYGGSCDLLDRTTGFPVCFELIAEEIGYGSYQECCVWARIDEHHLAECLCQAALLCRQEEGLHFRENARRKVMQRCGVEAVAERMATALNRIC